MFIKPKDPSYDGTARPWYQQAVQTGGPALTPAYVAEHATPIPNAFCIFEEERRFFERSYPLYALDIIQKNRRLSVRPVSTYAARGKPDADDD